MSSKNEIITVPTPLDILSGNAQQFIYSVCSREQPIENVTQSNYISYIAAIAYVAKMQCDRFGAIQEHHQQLALDLKNQIFKVLALAIGPVEEAILYDCCPKKIVHTGIELLQRDFTKFIDFLEFQKKHM